MIPMSAESPTPSASCAAAYHAADPAPSITLRLGDCLEILPTIPDGIISCIITDLPYGVTNAQSEAGKWDSQIPMQPLWNQFLRVAKHNAAIVLFAQGMFTAQLMMSQPKLWRYNLVWDKCRSSGFLNSPRMPLRRHEDICVFYRQLPTYNPQMVKCEPHERSHTRGNLLRQPTNRCYGDFVATPSIISDEKFPGSILAFSRPHATGNHPTEKPVDLCRWLIRTYTNPGETVLDATMGSGTTGVAAALEGRGFYGIEKEPKYFEIAKRRIEDASAAGVYVEAPTAPLKRQAPTTPALVQGELF